MLRATTWGVAKKDAASNRNQVAGVVGSSSATGAKASDGWTLLWDSGAPWEALGRAVVRTSPMWAAPSFGTGAPAGRSEAIARFHSLFTATAV